MAGQCNSCSMMQLLLSLDGMLHVVHHMLPPALLSGCPNNQMLVTVYTCIHVHVSGWGEAL